jgi:phospholipid transport system transporter-binding protein
MSEWLLVTLEGDLTFDTVGKHQSMLKSVFTKNKNEAINLNLSKVNSCDSSGLALMIEAKRLARENKCRLTIESQPVQLNALAQFCGVSSILSEMLDD